VPLRGLATWPARLAVDVCPRRKKVGLIFKRRLPHSRPRFARKQPPFSSLSRRDTFDGVPHLRPDSQTPNPKRCDAEHRTPSHYTASSRSPVNEVSGRRPQRFTHRAGIRRASYTGLSAPWGRPPSGLDPPRSTQIQRVLHLEAAHTTWRPSRTRPSPLALWFPAPAAYAGGPLRPRAPNLFALWFPAPAAYAGGPLRPRAPSPLALSFPAPAAYGGGPLRPRAPNSLALWLLRRAIRPDR
jgi:hypothetical protein